MEWLTQNWYWIILALGVFFLMRRGGMGCGMGGGHRHGSHDAHGADNSAPSDPISGKPVDRTKAVTAQFGGRTYYFESEQSLAEFNKDPGRFAGASPHRHHGGC
ncbi:YHS domain-containing protein [Ralstonia solanacearum]|uniref:YHS domain-containing protein n=1 Tax=Ralstonia solanacearum TaxID=305 RepID=UPI0005AC52D5|nr:YHS domain-containing protein [Ralstonia solanacearum]MDC6177062.1 YHS domain-containing protein [Ralstonia solanacearum]MDC6238406.1 YHS domain-containing protein [Ralstonia solanacearum]